MADAIANKETDECGLKQSGPDENPEHKSTNNGGEGTSKWQFQKKWRQSFKKVDSQWKRQLKNKKNILFGDNWSEEGKKRCNEIGITLKKMRDNDQINGLHWEAWIDYNMETKLFCKASVLEDDNKDKSIESTSM